MYRILALNLCILCLLLIVGCAWENLPEGEVEEEFIVEVTMRLEGPKLPNLFYYIVFNLSGDSARKPYSVFSGEDRGRYWNIYYMYGEPPFRDPDLYRGYGGTLPDGTELIDGRPLESQKLNEVLIQNTTGDHITLRINLSDLDLPSQEINMNMIVCNQAIDAESQIEYEWEPLVWDSFKDRGITMNLGGIADYWNEFNEQMEDQPNEREESAAPGADIKSWSFKIISSG